MHAWTKWNTRKYQNLVNATVVAIEQEGAEAIAADMRRNAPQDSGETRAAIKAKRSRFKDGGWTAGILDDGTRPWANSLAARAVFNEYGHAKPGAARSASGKRIKGAAKHTPPRPFMRTAIERHRRRITRKLQEALNG